VELRDPNANYHKKALAELDGLTPDFPVIRIPDISLYIRTDVNALLVGGWEPNPLHTDPQKYALRGNPPGIEPDWEVLAKFAEDLVPQFSKASDQQASGNQQHQRHRNFGHHERPAEPLASDSG